MRTKCVVVADGSRARFFLLKGEGRGSDAAFFELETLAAPGIRGHLEVGPTDSRPLAEPRVTFREELRHKLAAEINAAVKRMASEQGAGELLVVAPPRMLGMIREGWSPTDWGYASVQTLAKDYTRLSKPALQDALSAEGVVPPRRRPHSEHASL